MPRRNIVGCEMRGLESERPAHKPLYYDYIYKATDTGNIYWDDGTKWVLFSGAQKAEVLRNKVFDPVNNTILNVPLDPFVSRKREGYISPAMAADTSLKGALRGLPAVGTYSYHYASLTDGYVSRFSTSAISRIGYYPNASTNYFTRRRENPKIRIRARPSQTSDSRIYIGLASNLISTDTGVPLGTTDSGILIGYRVTESTYIVIRNNGTGTAIITPFTITKDTTYREFTVSLDSNGVTVKIDNQTLSYNTFVPALDTQLYPYIQYQSTNTAAKSFDISKGYFVSDI